MIASSEQLSIWKEAWRDWGKPPKSQDNR